MGVADVLGAAAGSGHAIRDRGSCPVCRRPRRRCRRRPRVPSHRYTSRLVRLVRTFSRLAAATSLSSSARSPVTSHAASTIEKPRRVVFIEFGACERRSSGSLAADREKPGYGRLFGVPPRRVLLTLVCDMPTHDQDRSPRNAKPHTPLCNAQCTVRQRSDSAATALGRISVERAYRSTLRSAATKLPTQSLGNGRVAQAASRVHSVMMCHVLVRGDSALSRTSYGMLLCLNNGYFGFRFVFIFFFCAFFLFFFVLFLV